MTEAISRLLDERAIIAVLHRYARGADTRDIDLMRQTYHHDATDSRGDNDSAAALLDALDGLLEKYDSTMHFITNVEIELDGDTAEVQCYVRALHLLRDDTGEQMTIERNGRFTDRFERRDGEWRVAARHRSGAWNEQRIVTLEATF